MKCLAMGPVARHVVAGSTVLGLVLALPSCGGAPAASATFVSPIGARIADEVRRDSELAAFYGARQERPIWVGASGPTPAALQLVDILQGSAADGLDPASYQSTRLRALVLSAARNEAALAKLEVELSRAFAAYARDLHRSSSSFRIFYVDRQLEPETRVRALLEAAASAPSLTAHLAQIRRMHPVYERLREFLAATSAAGGESERRKRQLILSAMNRARALPAGSQRHILVDAASARLWLFQDGRAVDSMRVIVGKPRMQTPALAALVRFAVIDPYWNLPPDLIRERARQVLRSGPAILDRERLELLSGWDAAAHVLDPVEVDWAAVAQGSASLRMRQLPGPDNMMGAVKFMLPNPLGIYLHDTPDKAAFARDDRRLSSGCVRVQDAQRLGKWLLRKSLPQGAGLAEQRIDLPEPVPVYITYLTASPEIGEIAFTVNRSDTIHRAGAMTRRPNRMRSGGHVDHVVV
jgi:murein L,D-transpeptidase YcbB/YkuD